MQHHTDCEDFNFAEIHVVPGQRKLDNNVLEVQSLFTDVGTLDGDSGSSRHRTRILTTHRVVPQIHIKLCRTTAVDRQACRVAVGQAYDELI